MKRCTHWKPGTCCDEEVENIRLDEVRHRNETCKDELGRHLDKMRHRSETCNDASTNALLLLRRELFPFCYDPSPWIKDHVLQVFRDNPDDPGDFYHLLNNHLLKRIILCLWEGHIPNFDLQSLRDVLHDPNTGLTYESLTGKNKQSVPDCERVISLGVIEFLEKNKYVNEAKILSIIHNWHKAVDGRGLSEDLRSKYLCEMKDWILDDWMPWDKTERNYSLIDVIGKYWQETFLRK
ncbi:Hypothetical predicted protein [Paramuricea clavata]|uniref:Uncharacterized protein n=1 Tax=Paramuricea clavata TaxID=317549 RepID=A0A6S7KAF0_PARCT|nr:Hypothetical predicted protein [Paramuricea clavata]